MILYHATPISRFDQIIKDKQLKKDAPLIWDIDISAYTLKLENSNIDTNTRTTTGYVYLTNSISDAVYYGATACNKVDDREFAIFRIDLDILILEPDRDNLSLFLDGKYRNIDATAQESLNLVHSVRVADNVNLIDADYVKCPIPLIQRDPCIADMLDVHRIEDNNHLTEYQIKFIEETTKSFSEKYKWIPIY